MTATVMFVLAVVTLISMAVAVVMVLATREAWRETRAHERVAKDAESERNCWKAIAATGDRTEDGFIDFHPLSHREAVRKRDINECMRIAEKRGDMHAAYIEEIRKLTSPVPGLAETGPYTLEDVDRIEAHRGKSYVRLRETVKALDRAYEHIKHVNDEIHDAAPMPECSPGCVECAADSAGMAALKAEPELETSARELLEAAMRYWEAFRKETGGAAVVWLADADGRMVMLTRGEYRDTLMRNIDALPRDVHRGFGS